MAGDSTGSVVPLGTSNERVAARGGAAVDPFRVDAKETDDTAVGRRRCRVAEEDEADGAIVLDRRAGVEHDVGTTAGRSLLYFLRASSKLIFSVKLIVLMSCSRCQVGHSEE